ncbi:MAG TPA: NTP transferase domain-containing protein, partial [Candidatus Omnitrophota bacterium]|nr:NTP transferase domain-containing protein [Candidatus Omnitrophota bacterium]
DMPFIEADTIEELIHVYLKKSPLILLPQYRRHNGHPPVFSSSLKKEFLSLEEDEPISSVIHKYKTETMKLEVEDEGVVLSFNTPQELNSIVRKSKIED